MLRIAAVKALLLKNDMNPGSMQFFDDLQCFDHISSEAADAFAEDNIKLAIGCILQKTHKLGSSGNSIPITPRWQEYIDYYTGRRSAHELSFELPRTRKKLERVADNCDLFDCIFQVRSSGVRALSLDNPLPTFTVLNSGGGAHIPILSKERRHLSITEMKRVMGFPEWYSFDAVSRTDAAKQLANAVCPPVIASIYRDILRAIDQTRSEE